MRHKTVFSFIFIPLLYVGIIVFLVFLQFSGGSLFNMNLGPLQLSGSFELGQGNEPEKIGSLTLGANGFQFLFDRQHPLVIQNRDESFNELQVQSYTSITNGYRIGFDQGVELDFTFSDEQKQALQILVRPPRDLIPLKSLRIPFANPSLSTARVLSNPPGILFNNNSSEFLLSLPPRSYVDDQKNMLVLPGDAEKNIRLAKNETKPDNILAGFSPASLAGITPKDYQTTLSEYVTGAYNAWRTSRYNSANGTWSNRENESKFNEEIMVSLLAEAWNRNEYTRVFNEMRSCADIHPDKITYRSSVFLGNLRRLTTQLDSADKEESERLRLMLNQKDPEIFLNPGLYQFAIDRGEKYLAPEILAFLDSLNPEELSLPLLLGVMQNLYLTESGFDDLESRISRYEGLIKSKIVPQIIHTVEGYYLQSEPNQASSYQNILAGCILQKAGQRNGDENIKALGQALVLSVIKLADELSYLPATIDMASGTIAGVNKSLAPEETYWLLHNNPAYPQHVSLSRDLGPGHWFYTIAQINKVSIKSNEYRINISYPRERTHYLIFRGMPKVDPQNGMQLFGITWRNAPDFEVWSKGRYYNPDNKTLMIKYYHDSVQNDIVIWPN